MSPTKTNNASESSRPRKVSTPTQKQRKAIKLRKIPKTLDGVPVYHYGAKFDDFINGDATIRVQPPASVVSESVEPLHVTTPQDTLYLTSYFPTDNLHSQIPVSERCLDDAVDATPANCEAEPFYMPNPLAFQNGPDFNTSHWQSADNTILSDQSYDFIPPSSSTGGSLSMEYCDERYQQWLDPNTHSISQSILSSASNHDASTTFPGNLYNDIMMYAEITGTAPGSSHLTMALANDGTSTLYFPNHYDANNPHYYY